ncbi:hypothetical protein ABT390_36630 [Streptomyces aurantiacus]|uniref:hypothetical protein n=1 Tax=Streptomyces aurantiacus TaxID=47760 RepID=UPI001319DB60|nr:hypothetical protein [Streptomyces aurantiacus]
MDLQGVSGLWTAGSFLLGQAVIFGGLLINNRAQARRERLARDAERTRALADRRETFELTHLQDLHGALSELLLVAEDNIKAWCWWHRLGSSRPTRALSQEEIDRRRAEVETEATALDESARAHSENVNRLAGLVIPDGLRRKVVRARGLYEQLEWLLTEDGPDAAESALTDAVDRLHAAQRAVAERIREIYVSHEPVTATPPSRLRAVGRRGAVACRRTSAP